MLAYHYSVTYEGDASLKNDYHNKYATAEPFIFALEEGRGVFSSMLLWGIYKDRLLKSEKKGWFEYAKDATEAVFEFVRRREFPDHSVSRLNCVYAVDSLEEARKYAEEDWGDEPALKILELELDEEKTVRYDRALYDKAYEGLTQFRGGNDLDAAMEYARRYFSKDRSETPVYELLSDGENRVIRVCGEVK